jgi:ornithine carbamoyltransferase
VKDLLRIADLSPTQLGGLLELASMAKREPRRWAGLLAGDTVVCYFAKPSTRTRLSFASAVARLGGVAQIVNGEELQLGRGETVEDTARVVSRYARAFVVRTFADDELLQIADAADVPVVNALTDGHHPCQALADLLTIRERFGDLRGLKVAYLGDGNNVANSLLEACALAGVDINMATPPGYEPAIESLAAAEKAAVESGSLVLMTHDPLRAVAGADVVYTDVWVSMGTPPSERDERVAALTPYRVDRSIMAEARPDAVFMHCLPAHRGEEVAANVIDGPQSVVFDQAENRLHTAVGVLVGLLGDGHGSVT